MTVYDIKFNFRQLKRDIRVEIPELPALFKRYYNVNVSKSGAYAWFERGRMPLERLSQLLMLICLEKQVKLDFWNYVEWDTRTDAQKKKKAA